MDIQRPDFETRVAILQKKSSEEEIDTPEEVLEYIAERVESNIRELEGMLVRVNAQALLMKKPITIDMARETLSALLSSREPRKVTPGRHHPDRIQPLLRQRRGRHRQTPQPRYRPAQAGEHVLNPGTDAAFHHGHRRVFSGRDHSTVMHSCEKVADMMRRDIAFRKTVDELRQFITNR